MNYTENMKPFPYQQVNAIEREMCDLRAEVSSLRIQLENAQRCLNSLQRKRQDLINFSREGNLFEQMFGEVWPPLRNRFHPFIILSLRLMQEFKFNISGVHQRPNGFQMVDILSYIAPTKEEAIANCKRNNPHFLVYGAAIDESEVEVVKVQSLR